MKVISPITGKDNVAVFDKIPVSQIVNIYQKDLHIDVTRFFNSLQNVSIYKCIESEYLFYYPFTVYGDEKFYDELKVNMPKIYHSPYYCEWKWEYEVCKEFINQDDRVYEIGAGTGYFLKYLKDQGYNHISGSELNHASVEVGLKKGLDIELKTVQEKVVETKNEFDVVCFFQVLEHIADVNSFLKSSIELLKPGGRLLISVPFNDPFLFKNDKFNTLNLPPHHMGLWSKKCFRNLPKFFDIKEERIIIEKLPAMGYDFDRFFSVNKDNHFTDKYPFKRAYDFFYFKWLKKFHNSYPGKNIIAVFTKNG